MVTRETLATQLETAIREDIVKGVLEPGRWLRQTEIAERYSVSQTPLREALQKLAATGLVILDPMAGAYVAPLSNADLVDIYTLRSVLEPLAIRRSIDRGDAAWVAEIEAATDQLRSATAKDLAVRTAGGDPEAAVAWTQAHRAFHKALMSRSDSRWLASFIDTLWLHSERYVRSASLGGRDVGGEHEDIFRAASQLDPDAAAEAVRRHLEAAAASRSVAHDHGESLTPPPHQAPADG
jgi:GntR family transcriptional regulator, carbon starvation induced regulator